VRLDEERESDNVEDRRGEAYVGGGGGIGGRHIGIGTVVVALAASYFFGIDPRVILGLASNSQPSAPVQQAPAHKPPAGDTMATFVSKVLADTEDTWQAVFREGGRDYKAPHLVLFTGQTPTACGRGQTAMGPFYCPMDEKVYIDLAFYQDLKNRFHAPGEFAEAYVIAHEVGHHVQKLLGISEQVQRAQEQARDKASANALSVRLELQADCFAGVWGNRADKAQHIIEPGDVEQALAAATAIGDDRLQQQARGYAVPDTFTHGTSEQRVRWFRRGMDSGDLNQCNTFKAAQL